MFAETFPLRSISAGIDFKNLFKTEDKTKYSFIYFCTTKTFYGRIVLVVTLVKYFLKFFLNKFCFRF